MTDEPDRDDEAERLITAALAGNDLAEVIEAAMENDENFPEGREAWEKKYGAEHEGE
jgi:hypothetical protein